MPKKLQSAPEYLTNLSLFLNTDVLLPVLICDELFTLTVLLPVIPEKAANEASAEKVFAGKKRNISFQKICKACLSIKEISLFCTF